ncbi:hypothetical protein [[Pseudomonas] boreopolis]|uniref:hypothetical protein n=1 Tax=Xanthomonas boreopolis TaxID=86183 RepID=UPI003D9FFF16
MQSNPMLRGVEALRDAWLEASADPAKRLLVWRLPANAARLLAAFLQMQEHEGDWSVPDYFLRLDTPFDTGFGYSRALKQALLERYLGSQAELRDQGVALGWRGPQPAHADTAAGTVEVWQDFARHHGEHLRLLAVVLEPERASYEEGLQRWIEAALAVLPPQLRLVLVDSREQPRWQPLLNRHGNNAAIVTAPVDMFDLARDTAAQSGGSGPQVMYRQLLTDLMLLIERGRPQQVAERAERALGLAQRHGWHDQQAAVQMMVAGAWLKGGDHAQAIAGYRQARSAAQSAAALGHAAAPQLAMQSWFGEAGCWLAAQQPERAAQAYLSAAQSAAEIPHPMFDIEGRRMAGWCLLQHGQRDAAREHLLEAVRAAKPLSVQDRQATTLPQVLWELLQLQDKARAKKLEQVVPAYLAQATQLHRHADEQAAALGPRPPAAQLDRIENELQAALEQAFHRAGREREQLIQGGDEFFRKVVAVGREFLDPAWNGLPAIQHPLDHEVAAWSEPPAMQPLPDPAPLLQASGQTQNGERSAEAAA